MTVTVLLDISRLIFDAGRPTPTGILRVELAYAEHFISTVPDRVMFVARNAFGRITLLRPRQAKKLIDASSRQWREQSYSPLRRLILRCFFVWIHLTLLWRGPSGVYRRLAKQERRSVYIVVSHANPDRARAVERLKRKTGTRLIYFIHDLIPLLLPEFETKGWDERCERRTLAVIRLADAILVNSNHTRDSLLGAIGSAAPVPRVCVLPLGVPMPPAVPRPPGPDNGCYFVMLGTIEPKKNHYFLLSVWRQLREEMGPDTPRLIIIGRRGWEAENVIDILDRSRLLAGCVDERGRLSDREVRPVLAGARALLFPSLAEGFGLPLAEALSAGVPVICSDIPAFREVGGDVPEFLDPLDGPSWRRAVVDFMADMSPRRQAQLERLRHWTPPTWENHFRALGKVIGALGTEIREDPAAD